MRALLDANVLLRTLLPSDNPQRAVAIIIRRGLERSFELVVTDELLEEVHRKSTSKPSLVRLIPTDLVVDFLARLRRDAVSLPRLLPPYPAVCRDPRDDYLLEYAAYGQADFLVTGDQDLLVLDGRFPFRIVTPPDFLAVLREQGLT